MTEPELIAYFNEHVVYELLMLRYSKGELEKIQITKREDQLLWNAMFATFNVSARNLYDFLKGDRGNMSVTDYQAYCPTFRSPNVSPITGTLQMLNAQCFHLSRKRTAVAADKVTLERIIEMHEWVESNMSGLIARFSEGFKSKIALGKADWSPSPSSISYNTGPTGPGPILRVAPSPYSISSSSGEGLSTSTIPPKQNDGNK